MDEVVGPPQLPIDVGRAVGLVGLVQVLVPPAIEPEPPELPVVTAGELRGVTPDAVFRGQGRTELGTVVVEPLVSRHGS